MNLWIIYSKLIIDPTKSNAFSWMLDEAEKLGFDAKLLFTEDIHIAIDDSFEFYHMNEKIAPPDVVFMRCYDIPLIRHFELLGIKTFNSSQSLESCMDKWTTHQLLKYNNIPTPKTLRSYSKISFDILKEELGLPFILKNSKGSRGSQVFLVEDEAHYQEGMKHCPEPIYQEYIKSSFGKDIRAHVIGGKFITCLLRKSDTDFKSNFSQGGEALFFEATDEIIKLSEESAKAMKLDFAGIDILFDENGYTVCEVNGIPGFRTVGLTTKENMPELMLSYIRSNL